MLRKCTDWANVCAAVFLGAYLVSLWTGWSVFTGLPAAVASSGGLCFLAVLIGLFLLAANGYLLFQAYRAGGLRDSLRLAAVDGANMVSPDALEQLFKRALKNETDLRNPQVMLEVKSGQVVALHLRFGLREQVDVVKRMEAIKAKVRDRFIRMLPDGVQLQIFVEVVELIADTGEHTEVDSRRARDGDEKAATEFDGPVYSDEGGSHEPIA